MARLSFTNELMSSIELRVTSEFPELSSVPEKLVERRLQHIANLSIDSIESALSCFFQVKSIFKTDLYARVLKAQQKKELKELAERSLRYCKIQQVTSRFSHLYSQLYELLAFDLLLQGRASEGFTLSMSGAYLGRDGQNPKKESQLISALLAWHLGQLRLAKNILADQYLNLSTYDADYLATALFQARLHRTADDSQAAKTLLQEARYHFAQSTDHATRLTFQEFLCDIHLGIKSSKYLPNLLRKKAPQLNKFEILLGMLWCLATKTRIDGLEAIKPRHMSLSEDHAYEFHMANEAQDLIQIIEDLSNKDLSLQNRFLRLGKGLGAARNNQDPEVILLFLIAAIRSLIRLRQAKFARTLLNEYQTLSKRMTDGHSLDSLHLLDDIIDQLDQSKESSESIRELSLYTGRIPRFAKMTVLFSKLAYQLSKLELRAAKDDLSLEDHRLQTSQFLLAFFEQATDKTILRGPFLKLLQGLTLVILAQDRSRNQYRPTHETSSHVSLDLMFQILQEEIHKRGLSSQIASIEAEPMALTSFGCIYRGQLFDGQDVVIKVRYPDIKDIIKADFDLIKSFAPLFKRYGKHFPIVSMIEAIQDRIFEESDCRREASYQESLRTELSRLPHSKLRVPRFFSTHGSETILISEFISGPSLLDIIRDGSREEREHAVRLYLTNEIRVTYQLGYTQRDQNPANYLIDGDEIWVVDLGGYTQLDNATRKLYSKIFIAAYRGDPQLMYQTLVQIRLIQDGSVQEELFRRELAEKFFGPFHQDRVRPYQMRGQTTLIDRIFACGFDQYLRIPDHPNLLWSFLYCGLLLRAADIEINWHHELGRILTDLDLIHEDKDEPKAMPA